MARSRRKEKREGLAPRAAKRRFNAALKSLLADGTGPDGAQFACSLTYIFLTFGLREDRVGLKKRN